MVFRLRDREKFLLQKIEKALQRIEDGTFGICERCEEDISPKRLEARPVTAAPAKAQEQAGPARRDPKAGTPAEARPAAAAAPRGRSVQRFGRGSRSERH